jgi:hypothetical protein
MKKPPKPPANDPSQFNLFEGEERKKNGMATALGNNLEWAGEAQRKIMLYLIGPDAPKGQFLFETFRKEIPDIGNPPGHMNAWGGLASALKKAGVIDAIGPYDKATSKKNHAHKYQLYVRGKRLGNAPPADEML